MSRFIQVFPLVPAPAVYLPLGVILMRSQVLLGWLARAALGLAVAFAVVGLPNRRSVDLDRLCNRTAMTCIGLLGVIGLAATAGSPPRWSRCTCYPPDEARSSNQPGRLPRSSATPRSWCAHSFAGDHALGGDRHDRAGVERWFERLFRLFSFQFTITRMVVSGPSWDMIVSVEWVAEVTATAAGQQPHAPVPRRPPAR